MIIVADTAHCQQKWQHKACAKDGRRSSFLHHLIEHCDLGRPERRWKDHEHIQDQDNQGLMDLTPAVYGDDDSKLIFSVPLWSKLKYFSAPS